MLKKILLFIILSLLSSNICFAERSLRRCIILPITDTVQGAIGTIVFKQVEQYLKSSSWCYYQSNSGLIDILNRYEHKLESYLKNPSVLKVIARKSDAGSLISINIHSNSAGIEFEMFIHGANGSDILFHEKSLFNNVDPDVMAQMAINWLEEYNNTIPFDAKITGILGDSFTIDMGKSAGINAGDEIEFIRPTKKRKHPLFKEIVDWETKAIAQGKILHVTELQSQGKISRYANLKDKILVDDWGLIKKTTALDPNHRSTEEKKAYKFGKLGEISFAAALNKFNVSKNDSSGTKRQNGLMFGGKVNSEIWITRKYWVGFDLNFATGMVSDDVGTFSVSTNSLYTAKYRIKVGYKYLPLGFFYGPQLDFFIGYEQYNIALDNNIADGIVGVTYSGLVFGSKVNIPVNKKFRLYIHFDFLPFAGFNEDVTANGDSDGVSSYQFKFGGVFHTKPNMSILFGLDLESSKVNYDSSNSNITHKNISFLCGTQLSF